MGLQVGVEPRRGVLKVHLPDPFPSPRFCEYQQALQPSLAWPAHAQLLPVGCCSLAQPGVAHTLSLLLSVPADAVACASLAYTQTQSTSMLTSAVCLFGLAYPAPGSALVLPSRSCGLALQFSKFFCQACSLVLAGASALLSMVCPQFWPLCCWVLQPSLACLLPALGCHECRCILWFSLAWPIIISNLCANWQIL